MFNCRIVGSFFVFVFRVIPCILVITCWERADLLVLLYVMCSCVLSLSHVVSRGRGTLIFSYIGRFGPLFRVPKCVLVYIRIKGEVSAVKLV